MLEILDTAGTVPFLLFLIFLFFFFLSKPKKNYKFILGTIYSNERYVYEKWTSIVCLFLSIHFFNHFKK